MFLPPTEKIMISSSGSWMCIPPPEAPEKPTLTGFPPAEAPFCVFRSKVAPAGVGFHLLSLFRMRECLWRGRWKKSSEARKWRKYQINVSFRYRNPMQHKQTSVMGHMRTALFLSRGAPSGSTHSWCSFPVNDTRKRKLATHELCCTETSSCTPPVGSNKSFFHWKSEE
ncbi:unnamed protein product [Musa acuminata subsp. burmannicoides]